MAQTLMFLGDRADTQLKHWLGISDTYGFYINLHSAQAGMLHQVSCPHLGDGSSVNTVTRSKVCAATREELRIWAEQQHIRLTICSTCLPGDHS
jgi:hypothetical protein